MRVRSEFEPKITMQFMLRVVATYPSRTLLTLLALIVAGVFQGIGLSALLPVLDLAMNPVSASGGGHGALIVDWLQNLGLSPTLGLLLSLIVIAMSLKALLVLVANRHVGYTVAQIERDLRVKLLRALLDARWNYFLEQRIGTLANAMATESSRVALAYLSGARATAFLIEALVYTIAAFLVAWKATLVAVGAIVLVVFSFGHLVRVSRRAGRRQTVLQKSLLERLTDTLLSVKSLKSMGLEDRANLIMAAETDRLYDALRRQVFSAAALRALFEPSVVALMAVGLFVAVSFLNTPVASVLVLILLLVRVFGTLGKAQRHYQAMVTNESAYWSLMETVGDARRAHESASSGRAPVFNDRIRIDGVSFAFGEKQVLVDLDLVLAAGSFTTVLGASGSGKTTLIDILTGLLKPARGDVLVDGLPLQQCNLHQWRCMIGYVPQETLLLHDTILHNVTLGDPALTAADAEEALRTAGADAFVRGLPEGLHTRVGERGGKLSGGQRQRLCIARALVRKPRLLILDEATSALDPASETAVCATLAKLRGKITILAISHQSGLADIADRVLRLEDGALVPVPLDLSHAGVGSA